MRGRRLTVGAVAHARRPHYSLSFSRFPLSHPFVSGSSTSTPWTTNEGEAPNSRCGGSCPTASLLALPLSHPPVSGSSTSTPWTTNEGRRRTVGAVAHARRPHYSLSFARFPLSHPLHLGLPMRGRRLTVGAVAHARRPHCSLSFFCSHFLTPLFPVPLPLHLGLPPLGALRSRL